MIQIGDIEITFVNDGTIKADTGGLFGLVPRVLWSRHYEVDGDGLIPNKHISLLVRANGKTIVVDTGQGNKLPEKRVKFMGLERPEGDLLEGLARHGVQPEDVDIVINTHLHGDHCGWNTCYDEAGNVVPTFPNAEYWIQRLEYADACFPNERTRGTYFPENYMPLDDAGQLRLIDGDMEVLPGMRLAVTPGHTRAHMSVTFEQGGKALLYMGDMATLMIHFAKLAWLTAYDVEPLVNLETKRTWQRWVLERDALIVCEHDPFVTVGRLVADGDGKLRIEAAPENESL